MRTPFERAFTDLSDVSRLLHLVSLTLLLAAFLCFVAPATFMELAYGGETSTAMQSFTSVMLTVGLLPFLAAVALNFYVATGTVVTRGTALLVAGAFTVAALWWWYGMALANRAAQTPWLASAAVLWVGYPLRTRKQRQTNCEGSGSSFLRNCATSTPRW